MLDKAHYYSPICVNILVGHWRNIPKSALRESSSALADCFNQVRNTINVIEVTVMHMRSRTWPYFSFCSFNNPIKPYS